MIDPKPNRRREFLNVDPSRFWERIKKPVGCWLFDGAKEINGYGYLRNPLGDVPKYITAHRLAWILTNGAVPEGNVVMHTCDVRACVNPEHLRLGTDQDNNDDKLAKARHGGKFKPDDIREIRRESAEGKTDRELAEKYGTIPRYIWTIRTRRGWQSVE